MLGAFGQAIAFVAWASALPDNACKSLPRARESEHLQALFKQDTAWYR